MTYRQRKAQTSYLILIGLGSQPLVQGSDFGGQVLEALPEHFFLWREEQPHVSRAAPAGKFYMLEIHLHSRTIARLLGR